MSPVSMWATFFVCSSPWLHIINNWGCNLFHTRFSLLFVSCWFSFIVRFVLSWVSEMKKISFLQGIDAHHATHRFILFKCSSPHGCAVMIDVAIYFMLGSLYYLCHTGSLSLYCAFCFALSTKNEKKSLWCTCRSQI